MQCIALQLLLRRGEGEGEGEGEVWRAEKWLLERAAPLTHQPPKSTNFSFITTRKGF